MIEFYSLPTDSRAAKQHADNLVRAGYTREDADEIAEQAGALVISTLRGLDAKIRELSSDKSNQSVIQSLFFDQMIAIGYKTLEINAVQEFMNTFLRRS